MTYAPAPRPFGLYHAIPPIPPRAPDVILAAIGLGLLALLVGHAAANGALASIGAAFSLGGLLSAFQIIPQ